MGSLFLFLSLLALLRLAVEESQRPEWWLRLSHALLYALFLLLVHPMTLRISRVWVDGELNSVARLSDVTLLVFVDLLLSLLALTGREARWPNRRRVRYFGLAPVAAQLLHRLVYYLPSLLVFPALFYLRVFLLFALPGVSFSLVTGAMALVVGVVVLLAPYIFRGGMHWGEVSAKLGFLTLGLVVVAALFAPQSRVVAQVAVDGWQQLLDTLALLAALGGGLLLGYLLYWARARRKG